MPAATPPPPRLNKYLSQALGISRREADNLITDGRVTIDGIPASLGARVTAGAKVTVDGKPATPPSTLSYIVLNKPIGYVSSRRAQGSTPTLYQLLPEHLRDLKTVGRLDKDSSGLILLTNDGDFAHQLTHPKFSKTKLYIVSLDRPLLPLHQQMIADYGIQLKDGPSRLGLSPLDDSRQQWQVTMNEGRNRQIRRSFGALGYTVTQLHRTQFGRYSLGDLPLGHWQNAPKA